MKKILLTLSLVSIFFFIPLFSNAQYSPWTMKITEDIGYVPIFEGGIIMYYFQFTDTREFSTTTKTWIPHWTIAYLSAYPYPWPIDDEYNTEIVYQGYSSNDQLVSPDREVGTFRPYVLQQQGWAGHEFYIVEDNANGDCWAHRKAAFNVTVWDLPTCIAHGGLVLQKGQIPFIVGASAINAMIPINIENEVSTLKVESSVTNNGVSTPASDGLSLGNAFSWMVTQFTIVLGGGLITLSVLIPFIIILVAGAVVLLFIFRAYKFMRH